MSDLILDLEEPKFYGIVAHSVADPDSRIIAIRGTEGAMEWLDDAAAIPVPVAKFLPQGAWLAASTRSTAP